jgi:hypothetical protein
LVVRNWYFEDRDERKEKGEIQERKVREDIWEERKTRGRDTKRERGMTMRQQVEKRKKRERKEKGRRKRCMRKKRNRESGDSL